MSEKMDLLRKKRALVWSNIHTLQKEGKRPYDQKKDQKNHQMLAYGLNFKISIICPKVFFFSPEKLPNPTFLPYEKLFSAPINKGADKGEGGKKSEVFAAVINGWPLTNIFLLVLLLIFLGNPTNV